MLCPKCATPAPDQATTCAACGERLAAVLPKAEVASVEGAGAGKATRLSTLRNEMHSRREQGRWRELKQTTEKLLALAPGDEDALDALEEACFRIRERLTRRWALGALTALLVAALAGTTVYILVVRPHRLFQRGMVKARSASDQEAWTQARDLLRGAAERKHVRAMYELGHVYEVLGTYGDKASNDAATVLWWRRAAEAGDADAMAALAGAYAEGVGGLPRDDQLAVQWYRSAAGLGNAAGMLALGQRYAGGTQPGDAAAAADWYRKAGQAGNDDAMFLYSECLASGTGVEKDAIASLEWLKKAAAARNIDALCKLGQACLKGNGMVKDMNAGLNYYREAASRGHVPAMLILAEEYERTGSVSASGFWYEKAASAGSGEAAFQLGLAYFTGKNTRQDYEQAEKYFLLAAGAGNTAAMFYLGEICSLQYEGEDARTSAYQWYQKAAAGGSAKGMVRLGGCYSRGLGVGKDETQAYVWYRKAAGAGDSEGMRCAGAALLQGQGVQQDLPAAGNWLREAGEKGDALALKLLGDMYRDGVGFERNPDIAAKLYKAAREGGYRD